MCTTKHEALIISTLIIFKAKLADFGIQEIISILAITASSGSQVFVFESLAVEKTSQGKENSNITGKFPAFALNKENNERQRHVPNIYSMYDLYLGLVPKESQISTQKLPDKYEKHSVKQ